MINLKLLSHKLSHDKVVDLHKIDIVYSVSLEKEMATHSSILARKNPMDGVAWQATVHGVAKSKT